jgi:hypothetical protein
MPLHKQTRCKGRSGRKSKGAILDSPLDRKERKCVPQGNLKLENTKGGSKKPRKVKLL